MKFIILPVLAVLILSPSASTFSFNFFDWFGIEIKFENADGEDGKYDSQTGDGKAKIEDFDCNSDSQNANADGYCEKKLEPSIVKEDVKDPEIEEKDAPKDAGVNVDDVENIAFDDNEQVNIEDLDGQQGVVQSNSDTDESINIKLEERETETSEMNEINEDLDKMPNSSEDEIAEKVENGENEEVAEHDALDPNTEDEDQLKNTETGNENDENDEGNANEDEIYDVMEEYEDVEDLLDNLAFGGLQDVFD